MRARRRSLSRYAAWCSKLKDMQPRCIRRCTAASNKSTISPDVGLQVLYLCTNEVVAPNRCAGSAAGVMPGPGNGLHGSRCGDECPGTCLLPHDEESMRSDGDAGIAWLLPEDPARRSR